jgi:SAM-dependent methyltransferase
MIKDQYEFMADCVTKFYNYVYVFGWFHHESDRLVEISVGGLQVTALTCEVNVPHHGVERDFGENKGFEVSIFRPKNEPIPETAYLEFRTERGMRIPRISLLDLSSDRISRHSTIRMSRKFIEKVTSVPGATLLDIGGRSRSRLDRRREFHNCNVTVIDILDGENVDVVGDAHNMGIHFDREVFDAIYSVSVFEHLLMPWKVVIEINKVLKTGGIGYIHTHQTLGIHDAPWDFWRYSDTVWDSLFNKETGFEILDRALDGEQFILPYSYKPSKANAERSSGFEGSAVLFRKIGTCNVSWPIKMSQLIHTKYPDDDDGQVTDI